MKRGQRKLWREVAESAALVASSENYAQEYMFGIRFTRAMDALTASTRAGSARLPAPTFARRASHP